MITYADSPRPLSDGVLFEGESGVHLRARFDREGARPVLVLAWEADGRCPGFVVRLSQTEAESTATAIDAQFPQQSWRRDARGRVLIDDGHSVFSAERTTWYGVECMRIGYTGIKSSGMDAHLPATAARAFAAYIRSELAG